jgi:hypothetical protein
VLLNLRRRGGLDAGPWAEQVRTVDAGYDGDWSLPVVGPVSRPTAVLVRPDGHVAWVGQGTEEGLVKAPHHLVRTALAESDRDVGRTCRCVGPMMLDEGAGLHPRLRCV